MAVAVHRRPSGASVEDHRVVVAAAVAVAGLGRSNGPWWAGATGAIAIDAGGRTIRTDVGNNAAGVGYRTADGEASLQLPRPF